MYGNPLQVLSLTKGDPLFFYSKVLQNWQTTDCNDKNICVAGFNYNSCVSSAAACFECRKIRVSAFSWMQWVNPSRIIDWLQTTPSSWADNNCIIRTHLHNVICRKGEQLGLVAVVAQETTPILWNFPVSVTLRLEPISHFDRVSVFKLEDQYTSNTIYVLV